MCTSTKPLPYLAARIGEDYTDPFAACRELIAAMFVLEEPAPDQRALYGMAFALYDFGPIKMGASCTGEGVPWVMVRDLPLITRTGADQIHIQYYRGTGFSMIVDGAERRVEAGDICVLDLARPVTVRAPRIDNLSAIIDRDLLVPLLADAADLHGLVLSRDSEVGIAVREHLDDLWQQAPALTVAQGVSLSQSTAALLASVIRPKQQGRQRGRVELRNSQYRAICRRIDRDIADPGLGVSMLLRDFGMARPTLYRMFEPHGGVGRYILTRRLEGVYRQLSDPAADGDTIDAVLRRWGFANHTAAGRAFRQAYGMTPSRCRTAARAVRRNGSTNPAHRFDIPPEMPAEIASFKRSDIA